jgi:hypothetical protein
MRPVGGPPCHKGFRPSYGTRSRACPFSTREEDRMSFLRNPSFENDKDFWAPINLPGSVTFSVALSSNPLPVTGTKIASVVSLVPGGSIGQDVTVNAPSVSCFAYVTSVTGNTNGFLNIWNLDTDPNTAASTAFTVQNPGTMATSHEHVGSWWERQPESGDLLDQPRCPTLDRLCKSLLSCCH